MGSAVVRRQVLARVGSSVLWRAGRLDLESMITHRVPLTGINEAIRRMHTGEALRTVIDIA